MMRDAIRAVVDTNGLPVHLALTPGEARDNRLCSLLLSAFPPQTTLLADRGYDADWIRELARQQGAEGPASFQLRLSLLDDAPNSAFFRSLMPSESRRESQEKIRREQAVPHECDMSSRGLPGPADASRRQGRLFVVILWGHLLRRRLLQRSRIQGRLIQRSLIQGR